MLELGVPIDPVSNERTGWPDFGLEPLHVLHRARNEPSAQTTTALDFRNEGMAEIEDAIAEAAVLKNRRAVSRFQDEATRLLVMPYVHVSPYCMCEKTRRSPLCIGSAMLRDRG